MRKSSWVVLTAGFLALFAAACAKTSPAQGGSDEKNASAAQEDKVEVKVVKYEGLSKTIKDLKGKVIVVDFWADT